MSERMTNEHGHDAGDKDQHEHNHVTTMHGTTEHHATEHHHPTDHDPNKTGMHRIETDPRKQIPAREGGEA